MDKYYFTCTEFKNNYKSVLLDYLNQHVDNEMNDFNKLQIEKYRYGLDFIELIVRPYNFDEIPSYIDFELFRDLMHHFKIDNHGIESYQDFYMSFENKRFEFDLDMAFDNKFQYLIKSWEKIIDFLKDDTKTSLLANDIIRINKQLSAQSLPFNPNHFNSDCYNLFNYLVANYQKKEKVKYSNIYKFLKKIDNNNYIFNFTESTYREYLFKEYQINLTTFNTANFKFDDVEKPILKNLEQDFRNPSPI